LKVEFIVLNQLTCLVQPNSDFFVYLGDPTLHEHGARKNKSSRTSGMEELKIENAINRPHCLQCRSLSEDLASRASSAESEEPIAALKQVSPQSDLRRPQARHLEDVGALVPLNARLTNEVDDQADHIFIDLERQYLGRFAG
jgi:hypothetical protein